MGQIEKLIQKFLLNPESFKFRELERVLVHFNFEIIPTKESHKK